MQKIELTMPKLPFAAEEALNRLRVNIRFSGNDIKKILITSSIPNEGKSTTSMYLWKMLGEAGLKTVFVDADLRKSVINNRYGAVHPENCKGLDYYLSGQAEYEEVVHETNLDNCYMIPATNLLENPSTLLGDAKLEELLNRLALDFDFVIIDSAPVYEVSDAMTIGALCDGALLVIRAGMTPKKLVRISMNELERSGCHILGTVLNGEGQNKYGYGKYGYKKYGYGYGEKKE